LDFEVFGKGVFVVACFARVCGVHAQDIGFEFRDGEEGGGGGVRREDGAGGDPDCGVDDCAGAG